MYNFTISSYQKLKHIYSRRKGFYEIKGIGEVDDLLDLPLDSKWYRYKGRIFIFRPKHKIASFVITQNNIYCPLKCFSDHFTSLANFMKEVICHTRKKNNYKGDNKIYNNTLYHKDLKLKLTKQLQKRIITLIKKRFEKKKTVISQIWFVV